MTKFGGPPPIAGPAYHSKSYPVVSPATFASPTPVFGSVHEITCEIVLAVTVGITTALITSAVNVVSQPVALSVMITLYSLLSRLFATAPVL